MSGCEALTDSALLSLAPLVKKIKYFDCSGCFRSVMTMMTPLLLTMMLILMLMLMLMLMMLMLMMVMVMILI